MANYEPGSLPNFRKLAGAVEGQTVVVSVIEWPGRDVRDLGVKAVAVDPRIQATADEDPVFDGRQLIAGCFTVGIAVAWIIVSMSVFLRRSARSRLSRKS